MFTSRVERVFEAAHHNGPPGHRCQTNHGHSWKVVVELEYDFGDLTDYGWGPDFGFVKRLLDERVIHRLDHQDLNDIFGDEFKPSAENLANWIFGQLEFDLPHLSAVTIHEGGGNSVTYKR